MFWNYAEGSEDEDRRRRRFVMRTLCSDRDVFLLYGNDWWEWTAGGCLLPLWAWGDGSLQTRPGPPQDDISAAPPHSCARGNAWLHDRQIGDTEHFRAFLPSFSGSPSGLTVTVWGFSQSALSDEAAAENKLSMNLQLIWSTLCLSSVFKSD